MYSYPDVSRKRTLEILTDVRDLIKNIFSESINDIDTIKNENNNFMDLKTKIDVVDQVKNKLQVRSCLFDNFKTEYSFFDKFRASQNFVEPISYLLGERRDYRVKHQTTKMNMIPVTAQFIPLRLVFKKFFELPFIFNETIDYIKSLKKSNDIISNFIQGELWQSLSLNDGNKIVFPIFLYFDDYENNNPLGSHRGISKCGAVYVSIPCLPPRFQSKLNNIFLFILFNTLDRNYFKNPIIFSKVKDELCFLEENGIVIDLPTGQHKLYFRLALVLGDNLGMHSLLGFTESFNQIKFCRFCLIDKDDRNNIFSEDQCTIRNEVNYENHLNLNDAKQTGIVNRCVLQGVGNFHPITNAYADVLHDILEGICRYDLGLIINYYIENDFFKLHELNDLIKGFYYGPNRNKPAEILQSQIDKKKIIMSASEMLTLVIHLPIIIGHLIPSDNEVWQLILSMSSITKLSTSYELEKNAYNVLRVEISEYLQLLSEYFPDSMKCKHHFLIHHPRVLQLCGSLWKISTMRYEAKHREAKITSRTAISRVNICKTIAIKHQLQLNYRFLLNDTSLEFNYDKNSIKDFNVNDLEAAFELKKILPQSILNKNIYSLKKLDNQGSSITIGCVIMIASEDGPNFYIINNILMETSTQYYFITKKLLAVFLDEHTGHYEAWFNALLAINAANNDSTLLTSLI
ncbi:uncharacterized protein LOC122856376 [Aphidius gifuensis]|uniref:uncharacterized protein LOC122856376 n=1 Tax=Aphidius gifuensis TaxID=684658 RepID=UPI001CDCCD68|nr:uncharacterized protein LOC122856376 [Aphidius gifuensis]